MIYKQTIYRKCDLERPLIKHSMHKALTSILVEEIDALKANIEFDMRMLQSVSLVPMEYMKDMSKLVRPQFNTDDFQQKNLDHFYNSLDPRMQTFLTLLNNSGNGDFFSFCFSLYNLFNVYNIFYNTEARVLSLKNNVDGVIVGFEYLIEKFEYLLPEEFDSTIGPGYALCDNLECNEVMTEKRPFNILTKKACLLKEKIEADYKSCFDEYELHSTFFQQKNDVKIQQEKILDYYYMFEGLEKDFINFISSSLLFINLDKVKTNKLILSLLMGNFKNILDKPNISIFVCLFSQYLINLFEVRTTLFFVEKNLLFFYHKSYSAAICDNLERIYEEMVEMSNAC